MTTNEEEPLLEQVSFKLPEKTFRTSFAISALLGFDSYEQYIVDLVQRDIELVKNGSSDLHMHVKAMKDKKEGGLLERFD